MNLEALRAFYERPPAEAAADLEPTGARPVMGEDDTFVGGLVGVFEGVRVRRRAVLASGA